MVPVSPDPTTAFKINDLGALAALVNSEPNMLTFRAILTAYASVGTKNPSKADAYSTLLRDLEVYPDMPPIPMPEFLNTRGSVKTDTFEGVFIQELFDWLTSMLSEAVHEDTEITTSNTYLIASMLSGSAIKTQACFSSLQVSYILDGLHMKGSDYQDFFTPEEYEVAAVGALIQVLSAAKRILELGMIDERDLGRSLEEIGEVIEGSAGGKLLQAARELAQNGFKDSWASQDIWALLEE